MSNGCIRLHNAHILTLAEMVPNGTPVYIVNEPIKVGVRYEELYLEGHRDLYEDVDVTALTEAVADRVQKLGTEADWQKVAEVLTDLRGIPERI